MIDSEKQLTAFDSIRMFRAARKATHRVNVRPVVVTGGGAGGAPALRDCE